MNNADFSRLVRDTSGRSNDASPTQSSNVSSKSTTALGSRYRSSLGMTPRSVKTGSVDFARQLAQQKSASQPTKKFKSSAAPKGTKLASGYVDRSLERRKAEESEKNSQNEKETRIQALEEQLKLGKIDQATFEELRGAIVGGDLETTHLVKGLDRKLLERVRKGEDVSNGTRETSGSPLNEDEEFEKLEQQEVAPIQRETVIKKGEMAPQSASVAGQKRSRNDILAEWKASQRAAAEAQLTAKFHNRGGSTTQSRIEIDKKGREVLITVDEHGNVKRKIRKKAADPQPPQDDLSSKPQEVEREDSPPVPQQQTHPPQIQPVLDEDDEDEDIFGGVGTEYDPLNATQEDESSSSSDDELEHGPSKSTASAAASAAAQKESHKVAEISTAPAPKRNNYFKDTTVSEEELSSRPHHKPFNDPTIVAALKRAAEKKQSAPDDEDEEEETEGVRAARERIRARQQLDLADMDDLDMGFGESRADDEAEADEEGRSKVRLSEWNGGKEGGKEGGNTGRADGKKKRNRKRKGNKDSADDVMRVLECRKKGS